MNPSGVPDISGANASITGAGSHEILGHNQQVIAGLDAEIALAQAALNRLQHQRNEMRGIITPNAPPSEAKVKAISHVILREEEEFKRLNRDIVDTRTVMANLLAQKKAARQPLGVEFEIAQNNDGFSVSNVVDADPVLESLEERIAHCQYRLERLARDCEETRDSLETHRALLSPIRQLPLEVLEEIFLHCVKDQEFLTPTPQTPPLLLSSICKLWRGVAHSSPQLWSSISITLSGESCIPNLSLVKVWIERSGSSPLSFHLSQQGSGDTTADSFSNPSVTLGLFVSHHARWRRVHLEYKDWRIETGLGKLPKDASFPMLESIYLKRGYWVERADMEGISTMLSTAPRLHSVSWVTQKPYTFFSHPWAQLTHFCLGHLIIFPEFLRIIKDCPQLRTGEFSVLMLSDGLENSTVDPFTHRNITSLELCCDGNLAAFFRNLTLPALTDFSIMIKAPSPFGTLQDTVWSQMSYTSFISRSRCSLSRISLTDTNISPDQLIECLQHSSSTLQTLELSSDTARRPYVTDKVLRSLTCRSTLQTTFICRYLTRLTLYGCVSSTDGVLADMLESRWTNHLEPGVSRLDMAFVTLRSGANHSQDRNRLEMMNRSRFGFTVLSAVE